MPGTCWLRLVCTAVLLAGWTVRAQDPQPATAVVTGRVLDSLGEPIVQATVTATRDNDDRVLTKQKTDGSGLFALPGIPIDEGVSVRAEAVGRTRAKIWLTPKQTREALREDLVLYDSGIVTGIVVDGAGSPIVGACVSAATPFARPRATVAEATTDNQGRFTIDTAPLGELLLLTWKRGFVLDERKMFLQGRSEPRIALTDNGGACIEVGVEGVAPAERASVKLLLERFVDNWSQELPSPLGVCVLDERGRATVEGLLPGKYQMIPISPLVSVRVRANEEAKAPQIPGMRSTPARDANLTLAAGQRQEVTFEAAKARAVRVSGTLRTEDGTALGGRSLRFSSSNGVRIGRVRCDASGAFSFHASLSQGERLWPRLLDDDLFLVDSTAPMDGNGYIVDGEQLDLALSARPPVMARGKVLSVNGAPLGAVRVAMTAQLLGRGNSIMLSPERHEWANGRTDADGTFVLSWDDDRSRRLGEARIEARDAAGCSMVPLVDDATALVLRLKPAAQIEGVMRDAQDRPMGGMRVRLTSLDEPAVGRRGVIDAVTTRDGRYRMPTLAEGSYRLELFSGGRVAADTRQPVAVAPGEQKREDFKLPK